MEQTEVNYQQSKLHPALIWRWLGFGLVAGFIIGYWVQLPWAVAFTAGLIAAAAAYFNIGPRLATLFIVGCLAALWRGNGLLPAPVANSWLGEQEFIARIVELPRLGDRVTRYVVQPLTESQRYRVLIVASPWPEFAYGDILRFSCQTVEAVTFRPYTDRGIWRSCAFPEVKLVNKNSSGLRYWLYRAREAAGNRIRELAPEPYATLATGMLWGDDSGLPTALVQAFRRTGTTHLLAVSGFNVMVLTQVLFLVFIYLGCWRRQASIAVLLLTALFVIFSGAEPSVMRAGAMGSILLVGQLLARKPDELNVLVGTAAVMLLITPRLVAELGWQLSFAAMVGLTYISPRLNKKLVWLPNFLSLRESAAATLAATLATTPVILISLGQLSTITPLANLAVAQVVVLVYWFGLSLLVLSPVGLIAATPAVWLLTAVLFYLTTVVTWLASLPWAAVTASGLTWAAAVVFYVGMGWWLIAPAQLIKRKRKLL